MKEMTEEEAERLEVGDVLIGVNGLPSRFMGERVIIKRIHDDNREDGIQLIVTKESTGESAGPWYYWRFSKVTSYIRKEWKHDKI